MAVDTPIGFPAGYGRRAEHDAKTFLGIRRNSVFLTFPRCVYETDDYGVAKTRATQLTGKAVNKQSFGLRKRMFEAEALARDDPRIIEVHPEVSFRELAGGSLDHAKTTWKGFALRRRLLLGQGIEIPDELASGSLDARATADPGCATPDDVLDAAVAGWTAYRKATGDARRFPARADAGSSEGVIWY